MSKLQSLLCVLEQADLVLPVLYTTRLSHVRKCSWVPILKFCTVQMFRKVLGKIALIKTTPCFSKSKGYFYQFGSGHFFKGWHNLIAWVLSVTSQLALLTVNDCFGRVRL